MRRFPCTSRWLSPRRVARVGRLGVALAVVGGACGRTPEPRPQTSVPEPPLGAEFREVANAAWPVAAAVAGDTAAFLALVQPFGPLDLVVVEARAAERGSALRNLSFIGARALEPTSELRNFFLGVVGGAAHIDPAPLADRWHCGPPCAYARRDTLVGRLSTVRALVARYRALPGVEALAPWPGGGYRVGPVTYDGREFRTLTASPRMGVLPWRSRAAASGDSALATLGATRTEVEALVAGARAAGLAALARDAGGSVRAVLAGGIADNEAGLLLLAPGAPPPSPRAGELPDGRKYVGAEEVAPGVYFYVTT